MSLTSAEFAHCMVSVNQVFSVCNSCIYFLLSCILYVCILCTTLCANSADDKFVFLLLLLFFPENGH